VNERKKRRTLNQPLPIPLSVFASDTFFRYAITGPLWLESMTSLGPDSRVWRQVRVAVEPACTVITVLVFAVGFGPPLQTMSLEVTSWMGWMCVSRLHSGWFREEERTHAIIGGNSHTIADCAAVQRGEDGMSSRGRCCCSENERCGELHVVCWLWSSEPLGAAPAMLYTHHTELISTLQTQMQGLYGQFQCLVRCLCDPLA
jgi:hypothetical protein